MPSKNNSLRTRMVEIATYSLVGQSINSCLDCAGSINIHQPDTNKPDRLLTTCNACGAWYLVNQSQQVMTRISG